MFDPTQAPLIPETLLKKRRSLEELVYKRSTTVQLQNKKRKVRGEDIKIKRPEQFVTEKRTKIGSQQKMERRQKNVLRKTRGQYIPKKDEKSSVGLAIRIHQGRHASKVIKQQLQELGLNDKYDAVFVKLDKEGIAKLKPLDAYVAYGYITKKSVIELVHRRAFTTVDGDRKPLSDNLIVEQLLGDKDIICLSDLSHEIFTVGDNFADATKILSTFRLSSPVGTYEKKVLNLNHEVEKTGGFLPTDTIEDFLAKIL